MTPSQRMEEKNETLVGGLKETRRIQEPVQSVGKKQNFEGNKLESNIYNWTL